MFRFSCRPVLFHPEQRAITCNVHVRPGALRLSDFLCQYLWHLNVLCPQILPQCFGLLVDTVVRRSAGSQDTLNVKVHCSEIGHVVTLHLILAEVGNQAFEFVDG